MELGNRVVSLNARGLFLCGVTCYSEGMMSASFRDLRVWQQAIELALRVYRGTEMFPKHELFGLAQQMRRAAVSVPSNIAEGKGHRSDREFQRFLLHARGSLMELETQILLANKLEYVSAEQATELQGLATRVGKSLAGLLNSLSASPGRPQDSQPNGRRLKTDDRRPMTEDR